MARQVWNESMNQERRFHRIAVAIVRAVRSGTFVYTLEQWSPIAAASPGTLRGWCKASGLHAREVLGFIRALTATHLAAIDQEAPITFLEFADERSLKRFLRLSGELGTAGQPTPIEAFCRQQKVISHARILSDTVELLRLQEPSVR